MRGDRLTLPRDHSARNDEIGTLYRKFSELLEALRNDRAALTRQGRELAEQKERLSVTIASIADAMLATDAEGRVVLMNPLAERMAGCTEAEAHGQLARDLFPLEREGGGEIDPVAAVLQSGQSWGPHGSTRLQQVGKRSLPVSESCAPMMGPEGRRLGAVLVLRDMSEVRRIEAELARMDRLATVQVLAAGLAHDFNNLLATIQSGVELVSARVGPQKDVAPLERVQRAILRARQLTRQLLTFTSGGDPIRELLDLAPLVSEAAGYGLRGSTRLRIDLPAELWPVRADDGQLAQVIQNLVLNASQVMREGGEVQISGRNLGAGGSGPMAGSPAVELQVRDRGPGIEPEHLGRIFEPFFSRRAGGSGLGLAVCHSIVQRHGGHIAVESTLGVGTVFTIWLPASPGERPPRPALPPPSLHQAVRVQPGRVLVMDDEPELRSLLMEMLGALGMEAVGAEDGQQALHEVQLAASAGRPFGLVILDLTVPGRMGGIEAASALRRLDPQLPLVVSSGYNDAPASARPEDFGFAGALPKPYTLADLSAALRRHLRAGPS
jgi:PAS domain S-box-containing protein